VADLLDRDHFHSLFASLAEDKQTFARAFHIEDTIVYESVRADYERFAEARRVTMRCRMGRSGIWIIWRSRWVLKWGAFRRGRNGMRRF